MQESLNKKTYNDLDFCPRCKCHLSTLRTVKNIIERKCYACGILVTDTVIDIKKNEDK